MSELTDLELCKAVANIEGWKGDFNSGALEQVAMGGNGCVGKSLLFDLQIKHGVVVKPHSGGFTDVFIDDYKILVVCATEDEIPRAILECILEANSGKAK